MKSKYEGLSTRRIAVECQALLQGSVTKLKIKTGEQVGNTEWVEEDVPMIIGSSGHNDGSDASVKAFGGGFDTSF